MPDPHDVIQVLDAVTVTDDMRWEYRRDRSDDLEDYMLGALTDLNRNLAIYGAHIIDTRRRRLRVRPRRGHRRAACIGTSVTSPAPKFLIGGADLKHLYHNSTLALDADTGEIVWYCQDLK